MYKANPRLPEPIYIQIKNQIKENVIYGNVKPGDKIPSVRDMAKILTANPNTVAKAYKELERENVIEVQKGRGTYISPDALDQLKNNKTEKDNIQRHLSDIIKKSKYYGISKEQLKNWIDTYKEADDD